MQRLSLAFFSALVFHLFAVLLPYEKDTALAPQLTGDNSIRISLASSSINDTPSAIPNDAQDDPPPEQEEATEEEHLDDERAQPKPVIQEHVEPVQEEQETVVPVDIPPEKEESQIETTISPSSDSLSSERTPVETTQPSQNLEGAGLAAAAQVTVPATPLYQRNPKPAYPALARRRGWQGTVVLAIMVLTDGSAGQVAVHKSSGHTLLDNSALKTIKTWRFLPGMKNGAPIAMEVQVMVHFELH